MPSRTLISAGSAQVAPAGGAAWARSRSILAASALTRGLAVAALLCALWLLVAWAVAVP